MLAFFLLEMELVAAGSWRICVVPAPSWWLSRSACRYARSLLGVLTARVLDFSIGSSVLLATLYASASYIAAPAANAILVPEDDPRAVHRGILGVTFPFNLLAGISLYRWLATHLQRSPVMRPAVA